MSPKRPASTSGSIRNTARSGPIAAVWVDVNNDGLLDLFIVNYLQWSYSDQPKCVVQGIADYCHPRFYKGLPNQLFLNQGDGTFKDVSKEWGIRDHVGKGMGVGMADYDLDGKPDLFVTNDADYNFLFHNLGNKFDEVAFQTNVALPEDAAFISGMGLDFRDFNNDGYPDIVYVALKTQTFPIYLNTGKGDFAEVTTPSGMRAESLESSGFGAAFYDFDNDGWKDIFVTRGHVAWHGPPGSVISQPNMVFRNLGASGKWQALTSEAGFTDATRGTAPWLRLRRLRRRRPHRRRNHRFEYGCRAVDEPQPACRSLARRRPRRRKEQPRRHRRTHQSGDQSGRPVQPPDIERLLRVLEPLAPCTSAWERKPAHRQSRLPGPAASSKHSKMSQRIRFSRSGNPCLRSSALQEAVVT